MPISVGDVLPLAAAQLTDPAFDLRMAVEEGKAARPVVQRRRDIAPAIESAVSVQGGNVVTVVDGIRVLVEQDQELRRTAFLGVRGLLPSDPLSQTRPIVVRAGESVHGDAASPPLPSFRALNLTEIEIGRASIEFVGLADVVRQDGFSGID